MEIFFGLLLTSRRYKLTGITCPKAVGISLRNICDFWTIVVFIDDAVSIGINLAHISPLVVGVTTTNFFDNECDLCIR